MKVYKAINNNNCIVGSMRKIAKEIGVSASFVSKQYNNNKLCKGYFISFVVNYPSSKKISQKEKLQMTLDVLKRAKIIIDEQNEFLCNHNEYANISIINEIDKCLNYYKRG